MVQDAKGIDKIVQTKRMTDVFNLITTSTWHVLLPLKCIQLPATQR